MTKLLLGLFSGIAFGFVIQRVGATNPNKMAKAHVMIEPDIPRFMLFAVVLSTIGLFGLTSVDVGRTMILPTSIVATSLAAVIFGIGWGLCGYCPGTTWAAAGEGRMDAIFALLGGLAGAGLFAQLHEVLIPVLYDPTNMGKLTLHGWVGSYWLGTLILVVVFSAVVYFIGKLWNNELAA